MKMTTEKAIETAKVHIGELLKTADPKPHQCDDPHDCDCDLGLDPGDALKLREQADALKHLIELAKSEVSWRDDANELAEACRESSPIHTDMCRSHQAGRTCDCGLYERAVALAHHDAKGKA